MSKKTKKTKKLAVKRETLRSLSNEQMNQAAGGTWANLAYTGVRPPPSPSLGCEPTSGCLNILIMDPYIKGY